MVGEGYKQTEIGVIPEDWEAIRIGDIAQIRVAKDVDEDHFSDESDHTYCYPVFFQHS